MPNLMIANPPRRRRRTARRKRTTVARRFSAVPTFAPRAFRRARRRRSGGGGGSGFSLSGGSLVKTGQTVAIQGAAAAAGFVGADILLDRFAPNYPWLQSGKGRAIAKIVMGTATAYFGRRFAPKYAQAAALGMAANGARDFYLDWQASRSPSTVSGLGLGEPGGISYRNGLFGGVAGRIGSMGQSSYVGVG